jgi:hypothetical protein
LIYNEYVYIGKKVGRAEALLNSLEQEKGRWQKTSEAFDAQMSTLIGDSLLAGAFLTYAGTFIIIIDLCLYYCLPTFRCNLCKYISLSSSSGAFDHRLRKALMTEWTESLHSLGIH